MESLLVLVGLIVLAIPVAILVLLVSQVRLRRRVEQLEQQIRVLGGDLPTQETAPEPTQVVEKKGSPWPVIQQKSPEVVTDEGDSAPEPQKAPAPMTVRDDRIAALGAWLRENWFYAVSALSLALAGVFLVQYGVESGLLSPTMRVIAALMFGATLIGVGEVIRRKYGDDESSATAYLPSVSSGAGLVTLFGGLLAARQLYDLIGPEAALIAMIAVALVGLVLGWFHGPLLAAVGLIGAFASPFVVGGTSTDPGWLYGYFFVIAVLGLGIDTVRRWAWISVLTLVGAYSACLLLVLSAPATEPGYLVGVTALAVIAIAIPVRRIWPDHEGRMISEIIAIQKGLQWPEFPTRLAFGAVSVTTVILAIHWPDSAAEFWLSVMLLAGLTLGLLTWASQARALQDLTILPAAGLTWFVLIHGWDHGAVARRFAETYAETAEADIPWAVTLLVALGALISGLAAWRSLRATEYRAVWAGGAAVFAPVLAIALELGWHPDEVIGAYPWALHAVALAVMMVVLAGRFARIDGENRLRAALVTLSALSCLTFACVIVLSSAALTIAFVALIVAAAVLDRRFDLPPMGWFIWAGVFTVTLRLVLNPGLDWANSAPVAEMALVYATAAVGFLAAWTILRPLNRPVIALLLESAAWATAGILLSLLLLRWLEGFGDGGAHDSHWGLGLLSLIWLLLACAQVRRFELGGKLNYARYGLALFFAAHGVVRLSQALTEANPLLNAQADPVLGVPILNTLAVAYLLPAIVLALSAAWLPALHPRWKQVCFGLAAALGAIWLGLTIRHVWQGASGMYEGNGVTQPELYSYTMALLLIGAGLFYQSFARRSDMMRKAGLVVIGLTVAKVFLVDIAGLGGLIRVFSLLALGLALAGLAWLNRWATLRHSPHGAEPLDH
ncbi:DUF2339 domain-containing protein [Ruegeria sp. A3M17]|uniref:DUF2339 domain-containing protein n=1 Tax=Ruegeria sp. A3M17 TaxID=2267229 RepID=UPI000DE8E944|nr:DUF2339 domain-containing protein [Ruegeria sp. A3M17]RBW53004.1 DUF2339 domain-containing protein [Ruegeria sp. A3M17]